MFNLRIKFYFSAARINRPSVACSMALMYIDDHKSTQTVIVCKRIPITDTINRHIDGAYCEHFRQVFQTHLPIQSSFLVYPHFFDVVDALSLSFCQSLMYRGQRQNLSLDYAQTLILVKW